MAEYEYLIVGGGMTADAAVEGIRQAFARSHPVAVQGHTCGLGSVKANLGHLDLETGCPRQYGGLEGVTLAEPVLNDRDVAERLP